MQRLLTPREFEIAKLVAAQIDTDVDVQSSTVDPRSYRLCSDRLCATGFRPAKNVSIAIGELAAAYRDGRLTDEPNWHTVSWMKARNLG